MVLNSHSAIELSSLCAGFSEPGYRGGQIYRWLHNSKVQNIDEMTNLSKDLRCLLRKSTEVVRLNASSEVVSKVDGCVKLLIELHDGNVIETVLLNDEGRVTGCISTQAGCRMGCTFCSTSKIGYRRNLEVYEILEQVRLLELRAVQSGLKKLPKLDNMVFMGMGEPLDNFDNLKTALGILTDDCGYGYSYKRITVSTCGITNKLKEIATLANVAVSLNAPNQELRAKIMPISKRFPLDVLLKEIRGIKLRTGDKLTLEYVLLDGINNSDKDAAELAKLVRGYPVKINLIRYNPGKKGIYNTPERLSAESFQKILIDRGIQTFIRKSLGSDIFGACGQLAAQYLD